MFTNFKIWWWCVKTEISLFSRVSILGLGPDFGEVKQKIKDLWLCSMNFHESWKNSHLSTGFPIFFPYITVFGKFFLNHLATISSYRPSWSTIETLIIQFTPPDGTLINWWIELNTKNSTKRQQSCRLVEFLVFTSAFGRHRHWLILRVTSP